MTNHKIIFSGPVGAGKTTAIAAISDIRPIRTDEIASDSTVHRKANTTVAMDYGVMMLDSGEKLHLYGTPGQQRFDFMWDILTTGGIGLVLLVNNGAKDPINDLRFFLKAFSEFIGQTRLVVGVTCMDKQSTPLLSDYHKVLETSQIRVPLFQVDARERRDVALLLESLLYSLDPGLVN